MRSSHRTDWDWVRESGRRGTARRARPRPAALLAVAVVAAAAVNPQAHALTIAWEKNYLTITGDHLPGGHMKVHYLEAYCRPGSTDRVWGETTIGHKTEKLSATADGKQIKLRCTLRDGVVVDHTITAGDDEVTFHLTARNPTDKTSLAHWAQPCIRVDRFVGVPVKHSSEAYLPKSFVFVDGKLTRMPFEPWATKARYTPGQVWCPKHVPREDVNPRPLSKVVPSNGLIGCFSHDEKWLFGTAFEPYQELFQGVIVCLHSDFRIGGLKPGETKRVRGKIYLMKNDVPALLARYAKDFPEHHAASQKVKPGPTSTGPLPARIAPYFAPPAEYAGKLGDYRSPLLFDDGTRVASAADWARRRAEILRAWHGLMGPWPPLIDKPRVEFVESLDREGYTQHRVRVEIAPDRSAECYLLVPDGQGPFPAVIVPYYDSASGAGLKKPAVAFGLELTKRGFVSLNFGLSPGARLDVAQDGVPLQPLSYHAYTASNCFNALAELKAGAALGAKSGGGTGPGRPGSLVDAKRIGIVGHSYGGKWAMFAAALDERFACCVVSDPGIVFDEKRSNVNYWEPWYLGYEKDVTRPRGIPSADHPRTGAYKKMIAQGRDLHELHALIAPRPFLVSGGAEDGPSRWVALNHLLAVNHALGAPGRVAMTNRPGHTPTTDSNEQLFVFVQYFLSRPD